MTQILLGVLMKKYVLGIEVYAPEGISSSIGY